MSEDQRKHLELIHNTIARMAGNLFYLRGWSITLIGGVLAVLSVQGDELDPFPIIVMLVVTLVFWVYDGYFLGLERKYRDLYEKVRSLPNDKVDFSMDITTYSDNKKNALVYCMFSKTIAPFYVLFIIGGLYLLIIRGIA